MLITAIRFYVTIDKSSSLSTSNERTLEFPDPIKQIELPSEVCRWCSRWWFHRRRLGKYCARCCGGYREAALPASFYPRFSWEISDDQSDSDSIRIYESRMQWSRTARRHTRTTLLLVFILSVLDLSAFKTQITNFVSRERVGLRLS